MKLAECEKFPKDRPQAALTVARSELLAGGSDETFHRMVHDALAFSLRLRRPDRADGRPVYNPDRDPPPAVRTRRQHLDPGPAPPSPTPLCDQRDQQAGGCGAGREISGPRRRAVADPAHHAKAQSRLDRPADVQCSVNDEHFPLLAHGDFETFAHLVSELVDSTDRTLALLGALGSRIAPPVAVNRPAAAIPASESTPPQLSEGTRHA